MSIRKRDVHFSDWTKVRHALVCNNVQGITETSSFDEVRAFLINSESGSNPFYYYVCYIKETNEIYTHGTFYNCTGYNDSDIRDLIQSVEDSFVEQITALQNEVEENEKVTTMALYDLNDRKANKDDLQNINLDKYVDWDSLYSETNSLYSSLQSSINSNYTTLNNNKADKADLEELSAEVEENEEVTAAALTELHENKADKSEIPDVSTLATKDDINLKQDVLSASDFATINGTSVFGGDNAIVIEEPDHYASGTATVDGSGFVTSVTTNEAGHVTKVSARAITDNDITSISASKITGTINIDNLPTGALERMFVVENETAAMSATVEEGDVVQVTGNDNKMYFCVRSGATTFSEKFMEFTAGTATSVAWSGVTGKPDLATQEELDVIDAKFDNYLPLSGGTVAATGRRQLSLQSSTDAQAVLWLGTGIEQFSKGGFLQYDYSNGSIALVNFSAMANSYSGLAGLFIKRDNRITVGDANLSVEHDILHTGNIGQYALPLTGGTVDGSVAIGGTTANAQLYVYGNAIVSGQTYLGGVLRNANGEWLLGESSANGGVFVGTSSYAQERAFLNYHGKLSLTAEGGVEAQLPFLYNNPSIGSLDNNGVFRLVTSYGWGIYAWVRNTGDSYVQAGTDSRHSNPKVNNIILQGLGGNVAIGGETASEKLHVYGNVISTGAFNSYSGNSHFHVKGKEIVGSYETNYFLCDSAPADGMST